MLGENNIKCPLLEVGYDLCSWSLDLTDGNNRAELVVQAVTNAALWPRRLAHLTCRSLDLPEKLDNIGANVGGPVQDRDVCVEGGSHRPADTKTANGTFLDDL